MRIGIIGGTGLDELSIGTKLQRQTVSTRYGKTDLMTGSVDNKDVVFCARHGHKHSIAPHRINYKSNIAALKKSGCSSILATAACGSLKPEYQEGNILILDQFLDFTKQRPQSFFDKPNSPLIHIDITNPYCPTLRTSMIESAKALNFSIHSHGCYACTEGPRYETEAEVRALGKLGGDVVGMTSATEAILAREAGLCYAAISVVTNAAAGLSKEPIQHVNVAKFMTRSMNTVVQLFAHTIRQYTDPDCSCRHALDTYPNADTMTGE